MKCSGLSMCNLADQIALCMCSWKYNGITPNGSLAYLQSDYETNGVCKNSGTQASSLVPCQESDCNSHCKASTNTMCNSLLSCDLPNSKGSCVCFWNYKGNTASGSSSYLQPDYETNGECKDFGTVVGDVLVTAFAIGGTILVRPAPTSILLRRHACH
jgi:hypothetical protein